MLHGLAPLILVVAQATPAPAGAPPAPDKKAAAWARKTLQKMTLAERVGQLVVPGLNGVFTPTDSDAAVKLERLVREGRVGGFHVFGGGEALPPALLNPVYGTTGARAIKGNPLAIAALVNRLQRAAAVPLLFTADFEGGAGYIVDGATRLPRAMALGATRDPGLAERAGRVGAAEGRAMGVHVDYYPVVDVNVNPKNPVIGIRSFGEDPELVARMAIAYMRGIQQGGMLATAKHFPGHGDTETDTHLDLATVEHPRARLDAVELVPFRALIAAGVDGVMSSHIRLPALDPTDGLPATLSRPVLTGLLRQELGFSGLVFTDSMSMHAVSRRFSPERAAALAIQAGADVVLDSPDPEAALRGIQQAVERGEIAREQIDRSVERILAAKARLGLHRSRTVDVEGVPAAVGGRAHQAVAAEIASRAVTLLKDEPGQVPLRVPREARVLLLRARRQRERVARGRSRARADPGAAPALPRPRRDRGDRPYLGRRARAAAPAREGRRRRRWRPCSRAPRTRAAGSARHSSRCSRAWRATPARARSWWSRSAARSWATSRRSSRRWS